MKTLNVIVGSICIVVALVLASVAVISGDVSMWTDASLTACMGLLCLATGLEKK